MNTESHRTGTTATDALELSPRPGTPTDVQASFLLWLTAIAAGVVETVLAVIDALSEDSGSDAGLLAGVGIRVIVYAVAVFIIAQMRLGKNWARIALAILLGGIGTLSLVSDPIAWLAEGHSPGRFLADADLLTILFASSRAVHLAAVIAALVFMFRPAANAYFRAVARHRR